MKTPLVWGVTLLVALMVPAFGRDLDGRYAQDPLHDWFNGLASGKGLCCSFADGKSIMDVDWDTVVVKDATGEGGHVAYRVRVQGQWIAVPDTAVVTEPNKFGTAVVWPYLDGDGQIQIRCFLPGAET